MPCPHYRRNVDEDLRDAERNAQSGDPHAVAALLQQRLRAGLLNPNYVVAACRLGHRTAQIVFPDAFTMDWTKRLTRQIIFEFLFNIDRNFMIRVLCDLTEMMIREHDLPREESVYRSLEGLVAVRGIIAGTSVSTLDDDEDVATALHWGLAVNARPPLEQYRDPAHQAFGISVVGVAHVMQAFRSESPQGAAGHVSGIKPYPVTKEGWRRQALFIADRILGLVPTT